MNLLYHAFKTTSKVLVLSIILPLVLALVHHLNSLSTIRTPESHRIFFRAKRARDLHLQKGSLETRQMFH